MGGERILVVDDEASVRGAVAQVLRDDGHQTAAVASAEEALAVFRKAPYPLVVSDIRLGSMDGLELLSEIKRIHSDTEVVIMTGHASMDNAITAMRAGAYDYLVKPFEDLQLISNAASRALEKIRLRTENRQLMETLGKILTERLRSCAIVARYGGEEFVMLLPETANEGALVVAEKIRRRIEDHPFPGRDTQPDGKVTVSLGVVTFPQDGSNRVTLVQRADQALYRAKQDGRNRVCAGVE